MADKTVARALLEGFYKGEQGANAFMQSALAVSVLEEELCKRLGTESSSRVIQRALRAKDRVTVLHRRLASVATFVEMREIHHRIETAFENYKFDLRNRRKTPG